MEHLSVGSMPAAEAPLLEQQHPGTGHGSPLLLTFVTFVTFVTCALDLKMRSTEVSHAAVHTVLLLVVRDETETKDEFKCG